MHLSEVPTPALVAHLPTVEANIARMSRALPGPRLRPHVKAFKSTAVARLLAGAGHQHFCCATAREVIGLAEAGLGTDLLLANELLDAPRLRALAACHAAVTVAVDSPETIAAAATNGIDAVLIDVDVGLPRCGCRPEDAGRLADLARSSGLEVRGVMGYEGHANIVEDRAERARVVELAMTILLRAHEDVGGDIVSGGASLTYDTNRWVTEIQAGSFVFMDTQYQPLGDFDAALWVEATVLSVSERHAVCDAGLKSLAMDHGNPRIDDATVWIVSDEHITYAGGPRTVGDRVRVWPAHIDPTIAKHERIVVVDDAGDVIEEWPVDLRHW